LENSIVENIFKNAKGSQAEEMRILLSFSRRYGILNSDHTHESTMSIIKGWFYNKYYIYPILRCNWFFLIILSGKQESLFSKQGHDFSETNLFMSF
jgi:hypothetical protein